MSEEKIRVVKVDRRDGVAISVSQIIGNVRIEWRRGKSGSGKKKVLIEESRGKSDSQICDLAQLEIPQKLYRAAVHQAYAILFPKGKGGPE